MKKRRIIYFLLMLVLLGTYSCNNNDDKDEITSDYNIAVNVNFEKDTYEVGDAENLYVYDTDGIQVGNYKVNDKISLAAGKYSFVYDQNHALDGKLGEIVIAQPEMGDSVFVSAPVVQDVAEDVTVIVNPKVRTGKIRIESTDTKADDSYSKIRVTAKLYRTGYNVAEESYVDGEMTISGTKETNGGLEFDLTFAAFPTKDEASQVALTFEFLNAADEVVSTQTLGKTVKVEREKTTIVSVEFNQSNGINQDFTVIVSDEEWAIDEIIVKPPYEKASNCYIVAPGKTILIPVSRANEYKEGAISATDKFTAELLWMDAKGLITALGTYGVGSEGAIKVTTNSDTAIQGNAKIVVKVGSEIKWSWHIWVTDYVPSGEWMDRNLGATANSKDDAVKSFGLGYQWGRKDPFPGSTSLTGDEPILYYTLDDVTGVLYDAANFYESSSKPIDYVIAHPDMLFCDGAFKTWTSDATNDNWNDADRDKTIYDPCPEGWCVPIKGNRDYWKEIGWNEFDLGRSHVDFGGYYPAAGFRNLPSKIEYSFVGEQGAYWSANLHTDNGTAYLLPIITESVSINRTGQQAIVCSVRCIESY